MNIALSIKILIAKLGISHGRLAEKMNVTRVSISGWSSGRTMPSLEKIKELADLGGVKVSEFISWGE